MPHTDAVPRVRFVQGQQVVNGEPTDTHADLVEHTATITDDGGDRHALAVRAFECGRLYGRAEIEAARPKTDPVREIIPNAAMILWPPPMLAPVMPLVPVKGRAVARPLSS